MSSNEIRMYTPNFDDDNTDFLIRYVKSKAYYREAIQISLDNCAIQRMERLTEQSTLDDVKKVGLYPLYRLLNECPNILISALGLNEMPSCYVPNARKAYNLFCEKFWKGHQDDPLATNKIIIENEGKFIFSNLSINEKKALGSFYLPYLLIQQIYKSGSDISGIKKFEKYLYGISFYLDMISGFEMEVAKYAFWDIGEKEIHNLPEEIRNRRRRIKNNFCKEKNSWESIQATAMNAAMDTYWIRCIGFGTDKKEKLPNGYTISEHWLATNDDKLYVIANDIKPIKTVKGFGYSIETVREIELLKFSYWNEVDKLANNLLETRKFQQSKFNSKIENIEKSVLGIELEIKKYLDLNRYRLKKQF
ncbi:hypothetical protein PTQ27_04195 [Mannheimia sp. AT1]|uniref:Uncharacterized protein n=1 Tax=Mannheimia cairinae TaxID=3025936 RepID=A0ABT5MQ13_9PAST|nr:hypothetical protein [Mannheimia cairinae]MDD0823676.1 hypothetical protein [Mannheimia cairinae]MDD0825392.1 hypothetical protein [Mannheimia cairinae]